LLNQLIMANFAEADLPPEAWARLKTLANDILLLQRDSAEFDAALADADGLVLRLGMGADAPLMDRSRNLRYIGMYGTGYGRIDVAAAAERSITVSNVNDYATQSVAELVLGATISLMRDLEAERQRASLGDFTEPAVSGATLQARTIGIIGLGRIGTRVAQLVTQGIGAKGLYHSRTRKPGLESASLAYAALPDLVAESDVVTLHIPATPDTSPLLDSNLVAQMKSGSVLINTSPNEVVDLDAVERRMDDGSLTYIMDHADELPAGDAQRLASHPNARVYPPIGYMTVEADDAKRRILVDNIENFLSGQPTNVVS